MVFGQFCYVPNAFQTYVSEVTTPRLRTTLSGGISGAYNLGMLAVFAAGAIVAPDDDDDGNVGGDDVDRSWRLLAAASAVLPISALVLLLFAVPESPAWLVTKCSRPKSPS